MEAYVEVIRADGSRGRHRIEGEQCTLGSSPTAGIPLVTSSELQGEHLLLAPRPDGCWVALAQGATPVPLYNGKPVQGELLPWGAELQVGSTRIRVTDRPTPTLKEEKNRVFSPTLLLLFAALLVAAWFLLDTDDTYVPGFQDVPHPELFDGPVECDRRGNALDNAREAEQAAGAKSDRYPFEAQDGIQAAGHYELAIACYRRGNAAEDVARVEGEFGAMKRKIEEDYHAHRLRLERALKHQHFDDALPEAEDLFQLTRHRTDDEYVEWLKDLIRALRVVRDRGASE